MYEAIIRTYQNTQYENYTIDRNKNLIKNKKIVKCVIRIYFICQNGDNICALYVLGPM